MNLGLQNKVVLVTGGARGIGRGIAEVLAGEGAIPVLVDWATDDNEAAVQAVRSAGGQAFAVPAELTHAEECRNAAAVARFGRIEGLVNNAGVNDGVALETGARERFLASLGKNLLHYYEVAHFALPYLKQTRGPIVNISSKVAETGQGGKSDYAAANGGRNA
jgi:L-fucose dehydrogenase